MKKRSKKQPFKHAPLVVAGCLLLLVMVMKANIFDDIGSGIRNVFNKATQTAEDAAQKAAQAAQAAADLARQEAAQLAQRAEEEAQQAAGKARDAANIAREKAQQAAAAAKDAEEKARQAAQATGARAAALAQRATRALSDQAVADARKAVKTVVINPEQTVQSYGQMAINMVKALTGHGGEGSVDYVAIYRQAIQKALDGKKSDPQFTSIAYQVLGALAVSADLDMKAHITWQQFKGILIPYHFNFVPEQWYRLEQAFLQHTAIPASSSAGTTDLAALVLSKFLEVIAQQVVNFKQQFEAQFVSLPGYLTQHPEVLAKAIQDFVAQIWIGSLSDLKGDKVSWPALQNALVKSGLDAAHSAQVQQAFNKN